MESVLCYDLNSWNMNVWMVTKVMKLLDSRWQQRVQIPFYFYFVMYISSLYMNNQFRKYLIWYAIRYGMSTIIMSRLSMFRSYVLWYGSQCTSLQSMFNVMLCEWQFKQCICMQRCLQIKLGHLDSLTMIWCNIPYYSMY